MSSVPNSFGFGFFGGYAGGYAWNDWRYPVELETAPKLPTEPPKGEQTDRTNTLTPYGGVHGYGNYPGYPDAPAGNLRTWRWMIATCPVLVLTEAAIIGSIVSAMPSWEVRDKEGNAKPYQRGPLQEGEQRSPEDQSAALLDAMFTPLWPNLIFDCCRCIGLGHYPFEVVWDIKEGRNWITEFAPFRPEDVSLIVEKRSKRFLGIRPYGKSDQDLIGPQAFNCHYDAEARDWYGRPRRENVRHEWWKYLEDDAQGHRLDMKATGNVFLVESHPGTSGKRRDGTIVDAWTMAKDTTDTLTSGRSAFVPSIPFTSEAIKANPDLANVPAMRITRFDLGQTGPASMALLEKLNWRQKNIVRGMGRPEREVLEATKGGMGTSDAGTHGQIGVTDSEGLMASIYRQINAGPVNDVLQLNRGDNARDSAFAKAPPLQDPTVSFLQKVILAIAADTGVAPDLMSRLDVSALLKRAEVPMETDPKKIAAKQEAMQAQADAKAQQSQQPPGSNGQGKNNGRQKVAGRIGQR